MRPVHDPDMHARIEDLERRLAESEETLRALASGEVDAVVIAGPDSQRRVYTLKGADEPYRLIVQDMAEGAVTLSQDGVVLFCNHRFADMVGSPLERVIGLQLSDFVAPEFSESAQALMQRAHAANSKGEIGLLGAGGRTIPVFLSATRLRLESIDGFCMVVTDLTEQKRNEHIVREERLARSILEQAAETILVVGLDGNVIRASRPAYRLAGASVLFRQFDEVISLAGATGDPFPFASLLDMAGRGTGREVLEMTARTLAGDQREVLLSVAPLRDGGTELLGCIVQLTDVTDRKLLLKKIRDSEEMYRTLANAMPQIVYLCDPEGRRQFVNHRWVEFTGNAAAMNFDWAESVHPDDRTRVLEHWSQCVKSGEPVECELRLRRHDGQYCWHLSRAIPVRSETGVITSWIGTSTDIHDFKTYEARLRESETRLRALAETVPEILFTTRPDGYCEYVSPRAYALTGLPAGSLEGFGWLDAIHPAEREQVREEWLRSASTGVPFSTEYRMRAADTHRWMMVRAAPIRDPEGGTANWFGMCADIEDHKRLAQSLQQRTAELMRSNDELQRFAYVVSHDLKEPLRTITGMSELLARDYGEVVGQEGQKLIQTVVSGAGRMNDLIRDLLDYSRVSGEGGVPLRPIDCNALFNFALMNVQAQVSQTGAVIASDRLPVVMADDQLVRVFQNLLGNALKYRSERPPEIHVSATEGENGMWTVSVRDNGIGLDMRYADSIFGVFRRLHGRGQYEGTGIGLAIAKRIIERYGGRIWVESKPGEGSTFYFSLAGAEAFAGA